MMPTEVIFEVGVCTTGSSASAPWGQGGSFYQVTPGTARGVNKRRSAPATAHELKYLLQRDQTSRSWGLFPLHLPSLDACLDDVQHSCCTYAWKICCSGETLESLHMHERNLLLATLCSGKCLQESIGPTPQYAVHVSLAHPGQKHVFCTWFTAAICTLIGLTTRNAGFITYA